MPNKTLIIAIQGDIASFHDLAVRKYFKETTIELYPCQTFNQVCLAVDNKEADYGVIAIENSLAGSLLPNYVLLENYPIQIIGEQYLHIRHNLMALPGQSLQDIRVVRSHPMALAQSSDFFEKHRHLEPVETNDTAQSAREISEKCMKGVGAVASYLAAELFKLEILEAGIENLKENYTRFFVIASGNTDFQAQGQKATLNFRITHRVGSLAEILQIFNKFRINLTLIQSVPIPGHPDQYSFHVDVEWKNKLDFQSAFNEIQSCTQHVHLLGIYQKNKMI